MSMNADISPEQLASLLPLAGAWASAQEQRILAEGEPLTARQQADARLVGVAHPERVRILVVREIPQPENPELRTAAEAAHLISPFTCGMALRYGIFLREDRASERDLLVHELTHTAQYERLGGFAEFLSQYLFECIMIGYPEGPLEQEAILSAERVCGKAP